MGGQPVGYELVTESEILFKIKDVIYRSRSNLSEKKKRKNGQCWRGKFGAPEKITLTKATNVPETDSKLPQKATQKPLIPSRD